MKYTPPEIAWSCFGKCKENMQFFVSFSVEVLFPFGAAKSSHLFNLARVLRSRRSGERVFEEVLYFVK
jgi:hypothetical protein